MTDPTARFAGRADDYTRGRPTYPDAVYDALQEIVGLAPPAVVADVGSGTGISSAPFLRRGHRVYGVEPNGAMRRAAEAAFAGAPGFTSVDGTAEATTLPEASVDLVMVAQAFHWLDVPRARAEFVRILRPPGHVALLWNWRRLGGTPFLDAYEALLLRWGTDYRAVKDRYRVRDSLAGFFTGPHVSRTFPHASALDHASVRALLLSASYTPHAAHPDREPMLHALDDAFAAHARDGVVEIAYDAELHVGKVS